MKRALTLLAFTLLLVGSLCAQHRGHGRNRSREFDFSVRAGLNMSQIDGDNSGLYSHPGFHLGVNTSFPLGDGDDWRFLVEIGLTQKGSLVKQIDRRISLFYVEVPLMLTYTLMDNHLRLGAGVAPAILASANVKDDGIYNDEQSANYKPFDWLPLVLGARYKVSDRIAFDVRYYNSMLNVAKVNGVGAYRIFRSNKGQFNRLVQAGIVVCF